MKKLIDFFIERPLFVYSLTVFIVVLGIYSAFKMRKEVFPAVDFEWISVRVNYPGASAIDVEKLVTKSLERQVRDVDGIEEVHAMSGEGYSILSLKVTPGENTDDVAQDVKDALDQVNDLPTTVEKPLVRSLSNKNRALLKIVLTGAPFAELKILSKKLRDHLEEKTSLSQVELESVINRKEIFEIKLDSSRLIKNELTISMVSQAINDREISLTGGKLLSEGKEILVRTSKEFTTEKDFEKIIIRSNNGGNHIYLKDIASVSRKYKENQREDFMDGQEAIFLKCLSKNSRDVLVVAEEVKLELTKFLELHQKDFPKVRSRIIEDSSFYVKRRLSVLTSNAIQGFFLVLLVLLCFLNMRASLFSALGIPSSFLISLIVMYALGLSINLISMFGLIVVLGMLVDDSIVVNEQYFQYLEEGMDKLQAAKKAAYDTIAPVTSTILTTIISFSSLFFMSGVMGKFVWQIPAVIIICLVASWLECYLILPGHLYHFVKLSKNHQTSRRQLFFQKIVALYGKILSVTIRHPLKFIFLFFALFVFSIYGLIKKTRFELFPSDDVTEINIGLKGPVGVVQEQTKLKLMELEKLIKTELKSDEINNMYFNVGYAFRNDGQSRFGTQYGSLKIELTMNHERKRSIQDIISQLGDLLKRVETSEFKFTLMRGSGGPPRGKAISVELFSESLTTLNDLSKELISYLKSIDGVLNAEIDFEDGKEEILIDINEAEARRLGLTNQMIATEVRGAFEGLIPISIKGDDEDIDVYVRLDEANQNQESILSKIQIQNNSGRAIYLSQVASFKRQPSAFMIRRYNGKRAFGINAEVDVKKINSLEANEKIEKFLNTHPKFNQVFTFALRGEKEDTNESLNDFKTGFLICMFVMFMVLFIQLNSMIKPLIILCSIPFCFIGVYFAFKIFNLPISFMALMGMLGLSGVVVNDSILLVTYIGRKIDLLREQGVTDYYSAIYEGATSRLRAIVLTSVTTIIGIIPVAHSDGGDPFLKPFAVSFGYGLMFATFITLLFVPACFSLYVKVSNKLTAKA